MEMADEASSARTWGAGRSGPVVGDEGRNDDDGNAGDAITPRQNLEANRHGNPSQEMLRSEVTGQDDTNGGYSDPGEEKRNEEGTRLRRGQDNQENSEENWL